MRIILVSIILLSLTSCYKKHVVMLWQPLCDEDVCVVDNVISLSEKDMNRLKEIASEYESEGLEFDGYLLTKNSNETYTLLADKVDYYGAEITLSYINQVWEKISVTNLLY